MLQTINLSNIKESDFNSDSDTIMRYSNLTHRLQDGDTYILRKSYVAKNNVELIENNYYDFDFKDILNKGKNENKMYLKLIKYLESKDGYAVMATSDNANVDKEMEWYENVRENVENG